MTIGVIAKNTLLGYLRERIILVVFIFAFLLITASYVLSPLAVGAQKKIIVDIGLASVSIFGVLLIVLLGAGSFYRDKESGVISTVLSKPVSKVDFLLGKYFGTVITIVLVMLMMGMVFIAMLLLSHASITLGILWAMYLSVVEIMLIAAFMVFFSSFSTPVLSSFFTLCIFVSGHLSKDILTFGEHMGQGAAKVATNIFFYVIPNLALFNIRQEAVHNLAIPDGLILAATTYGLFYASFILLVSSLIYRVREIA